jgi:hypothetical protein
MHHDIKTWWNGGIAPPFLSSELDRGEWSVYVPAALPPEVGWAPKPVWALWRRENLAPSVTKV